MATDVMSAILGEFKGERGDLIPVLQRSQERMGYLRQDAIRQISRWLKVSENEIFGVATFYAQFRLHPPGEHHIRVCLGTACHVKGGEQILDTAKRRLKIETGETTADRQYDLERVACLGCCALAPVVTFDDKIYSQMSVLRMQRLLDEEKRSGRASKETQQQIQPQADPLHPRWGNGQSCGSRTDDPILGERQ